MVRPPSVRRTLAALVLLALAVWLLVSLGQWQLRRGAERRAVQAAIDAGRRLAPLALAHDTATSELTPWRPARATGHWLKEGSVWLENRNYQGRPGYWVATPLALDGPVATALLVLRGWVPRSAPGQPEPELPPTPEGTVTVTGELSPHVPRLFELWSFGGAGAPTLPARLPAADGRAPRVQNLELAAYGQATGLTLLPAVLAQTAPADDGLVREWPQPSVDFNQNEGYALQWFCFAAIAAIAWLVVLARALRRYRHSHAKRTPL
jgi:surfeit locus 1 family protein